MGFMGLADGGRIKVAVNCKSSAEFMREERKKKQCKYARIVGGFCFKSSVAQKTQLIHCVNYGLLDFLFLWEHQKCHHWNYTKEVILFNLQRAEVEINKN